MNGWDRAGLLPLFVAAGHACSREPSGHKAAPEPEPGSRAAAAPSPVPPGLDLPAAVEGFSASAPTTGPGFVRRAYDRGAARVTVTLAPLDLGPGGYERWLRSEEHTSELQSRENLVCRLLLEKKKKTIIQLTTKKKKKKKKIKNKK